jgi:hypothetical protein
VGDDAGGDEDEDEVENEEEAEEERSFRAVAIMEVRSYSELAKGF